MIVCMHVASGAAGGALVRSRLRALMLGPLLHAVGDSVPHRDIPSKPFEIASGLALVGVVARARGPLDRAVIGALAAAAPDIEHVLPLPRPGGRKLFPSHRISGWHREGGISAPLQLALAGVIVGILLRSRKEHRECR